MTPPIPDRAQVDRKAMPSPSMLRHTAQALTLTADWLLTLVDMRYAEIDSEDLFFVKLTCKALAWILSRCAHQLEREASAESSPPRPLPPPPAERSRAQEGQAQR